MNQALEKLPYAFIEKLKKIYPQQHPQILNTFLQKKMPSFRINYGKTDLRTLRRRLQEHYIRAKELEFPPGAFLLKSDLRKLQSTPLYTDGFVYVQNVSSMLVPLVLAPQEEETILDLCAAPGTKTTQIVSLAPHSRVTAIEKSRVRYYKLLANLKIQGVTQVEPILLDGFWIRKKFPEHFDKILLDAPCSVEAGFFVNNPRSFMYWKERKVKEMVNTQKKLMYSAFFALKEGGELVYSTCTFSPEENEEIVDWFLEKFKGKVELLPIQLPLANIKPGLTRWKDKQFSSAIQRTKRVIPNEYMEGFFLAKLKKLSP
jgi:NOL1/NOP2/sun family putative RNA methylase